MIAGSILAPRIPVAAASQAASSYVQKVAVDAIAVLANRSQEESERKARFRKIITSNFDVPGVGRFVLGSYWSTASADQQKRFLTVFERALSQIYIERFFDYDGHSLKVQGTRPAEGGAVLVQTTISAPTGSKVYAVDWLVLGLPGKEKCIDVVIDGISTTTTTRQDYAAVLRANNGSVDDLIAKLQAKVQ